MPSAILLRKNLLAILQEKILPELRRQSAPPIVLAKLPLRTPSVVKVRPRNHPPLRESDASRNFPGGKIWQDAQLHASKFPALFCVVEGEADLIMGVTAAMRNRLAPRDKRKYASGSYIFSLPAFSCFLVPPEVPQKTGAVKPWLRPSPHIGRLCFLHLRTLPVGALCNFSAMTNDHYEVQYSLLIKDTHLSPVIDLLIDELGQPEPDTGIVHAQLLTLMLRLHRDITVQAPAMTDGLYSRFPDSEPHDVHAHILHDPLIQRAHDFIRQRLHDPLTPTLIGAQLNLTPVQLNRLFKSNTGLTTMNYVLKLRMESAQLLLRTSDLSVREISELVGFRQLPYFSRMFHRHAGSTPLQYRRQNPPLP